MLFKPRKSTDVSRPKWCNWVLLADLFLIMEMVLVLWPCASMNSVQYVPFTKVRYVSVGGIE
jgi:hypothetical protein